MESQLITSAAQPISMYFKLQIAQLLSHCLRDRHAQSASSVNSRLNSLFRASNRTLGKWGSRARHFDRQRRELGQMGWRRPLCRFPQAACPREPPDGRWPLFGGTLLTACVMF